MSQEEQHNLEEQVISAAVEMGLSTQLDSAENLNVDVQTNLLEIVQGQAHSVSVSGQGLVVQKDIRVQEMEIQTDKIAINPLSVLFGEIKLSEPTDVSARIALSEDDLNRALNSDYVRRQMQGFKLDVDGQAVIMEIQKMSIKLPDVNTIVFNGSTTLQEGKNSRLLDFQAVIHPGNIFEPLFVEAFQCHPSPGISLQFAVALMEKFKELVFSPYFAVNGTAVRVRKMELEKGQLTIYTTAKITEIPS
ncbi:hypothetical protein NIES2119_11170 [[Phormidium ambiguum] IAM M-71]|uniref:DUF2993 domain-containing protein n=1 Tax=[Phormidium ambiguum] IAM M-71 TaxID=454136 RepID=A0A1U7ILP9_9CYAN|nr:DUF2993 domain-containing protein [Phormidium ambiguum]OKH38110.1 hypothetical protein NIES2119_11170 [Phormidium ambiguum IAM M-71]